MESHALDLEDLARRFLKPDRQRLAGLREQARRHRDVPGLLSTLGPDFFGPDWPQGLRSFRLNAREAAQHPDCRVLSGAGWVERTLDRPPTLAAAVLYLSDVQAMVRAERAVRECARRLWLAQGLPGEPPTEVIWRISGAGSAPSSYHRLDVPAVGGYGPLGQFLQRLGRKSHPSGVRWTGAFQALVDIAVLQGQWRDSPDPIEPFVEVWQTGCGVWSITETHLCLFVPEVGDAPSRSVDIRSAQPALDAELVRLCQTSYASAHQVQVLLDRGADPDVGLRRLSTRYLQGKALTEVVQVLLRGGADPGRTDDDGLNALARHLCQKDADPQPFLDAGFPLEARDLHGRTAMHQATSPARPQVLEALLRCGAQVDVADAQGMTPLHAALLHGQDMIVERLLVAGADPRRVTADGRTVYHLAALGVRPQQLAAVVQRLVQAGAPNTADRYGWLPATMLPREIADLLPAAADRVHPPELGLWSVCAEPVPEALVLAVHGEERGAWEVLGDWLQHHDDVRGELVALALAAQEGRAPRERLAHELARHRHVLLAPFAEAHPLGARLQREGQALVSFHRGVLWELGLPASFEPGLPALLQTSATSLLQALRLTVAHAGAMPRVLPERLLVRQLSLTVEGGDGVLWLPSEAVPQLRSLHLRAGLGASLELEHPRLQTLRVEHPYQPEQPWHLPLTELETPALASLELVASRAPLPADPGLRWLLSLLGQPPPVLEHLELRPVSVELFEALPRTRLLDQIRSLTLSSVQPPLLEVLERYSRDLAHLTRLEVRVLGMTRLARQAAQRRLVAALPQAELVGTDYRKVGGY
jgi:hypothetical protein